MTFKQMKEQSKSTKAQFLKIGDVVAERTDLSENSYKWNRIVGIDSQAKEVHGSWSGEIHFTLEDGQTHTSHVYYSSYWDVKS